MFPNPEEIYSYYHSEAFKLKNGFYPKNIIDFSKIKNNPNWIYFEKFSKMVENSCNLINWRLYIKSLISFYKGYFNPKILCSQSSIKIYKTEIQLLEQDSNIKNIEKRVDESIKNIIKYMKENNFSNLNQYLLENSELFPTLSKHLYSGFISKYFLVLIPNIISIINIFPIDVKNEYFEDFLKEYEINRNKILGSSRLRKISDHIESFFKKAVEKI